MAAVFPIRTDQPWTFNGVTYEYDATEDRWFVISTAATDSVVEGISDNRSQIDVLDTIIDQEIENRTALLDVAASKNNQQDSAINELDARVDALASASGSLQFKGVYTYVLEKTTEACTAAYAECLLQAGGDVPAATECNRLKAACDSAVSDAYPTGSFTSKGTTNVIKDIEEFIITTIDSNGQTIDWLNVAEEGDYLEFFESTDGDTALYEIVDEPGAFNTEQTIRVKFISQSGTGDGKFNLQTSYDVRVFKAAQGIDLGEADLRYVAKPYVVYFEDTPGDITPVHSSGLLRNGELWFDTSSLEMFVWNNNSWVAVTPPPTQDVTIAGVIDDVDRLLTETAQQAQRVNSLVSDLILENNIYYSDGPPVGDITGTLRNGDIWIDSDDLSIKFYSMGAWINPDRQVGGAYLETTGGAMTGDLAIEKDPAQSTGAPRLTFTKGGNNVFGMWQYGDDECRLQIEKGYDFKIISTHSNDTLYSHIIIQDDFTEIHSLKDPTSNDNAVNLGYLSTNYFPKTGGAITGNVQVKDSNGVVRIDIQPDQLNNRFDVIGDQRITGKLKVKSVSNSIDASNSFEAGQSEISVLGVPLIVKDGNFENLKVNTNGSVYGREGVVPSIDRQLANKKYVDDQVRTSGSFYRYVAQNGLWDDTDWQNSTNDGKFSASGDLSNGNHFWYFSDIDQNDRMLNLREFGGSDKETLYIQIGHYSHTYLNDPNVNRDGMKIVWAGMVEQATRVKTGPLNNKVNTPGWQVFLNRGTGDNSIPGGTITSGGTYYIQFGGLL